MSFLVGLVVGIVGWCIYNLGRKHGHRRALDAMEVAYETVPPGLVGVTALMLRIRWQSLLEQTGRGDIGKQAARVRADLAIEDASNRGGA